MPPVRRSDEQKFFKSLKSLFQGLIDDTKKGGGVIGGDQSRIRRFMQSNPVSKYLNNVISKMANVLRKKSATSWREKANKSKNGRRINQTISHEMKGKVGEAVWNIVSDNSAYIKTLPDEWARYASEYAARMTMKGARPETVEADLRKVIPQHMQKNLKTIARTECAKANAAIVQARAEMCGIRAYIWRCVKDERSRASHINMDGVLVFFDDPPSPEALVGEKAYGNYHAGNTFNCRCYMEPVVDPAFLPDVVRVYRGGGITSLKKGELIKMLGGET